MRIDNNLRAGNVTGRAATARSGSSGTAFFVDEGPQTSRAAAGSAVVSAASVGSLIALQAAEDPLQGRKKTIRRGRSLLGALDALKADLLVGRIGEGNLNQLAALIGQARGTSEPELEALLDDIELRVRVELAKRGIYPAL